MDHLDLSKGMSIETANHVAHIVKNAIRHYASQSERKCKRSSVNKNVKNFFISAEIAKHFLHLFPEGSLNFSLDEHNNYLFSRAAFYKGLISNLKSIGVKSRRSDFYEYLVGPKAEISNFYDLICPDYLNGLITNLSLHVYMSDLSREKYYNFISSIHDEGSAESHGSFTELQHASFVLRTLCSTMALYEKDTFKIQGTDYNLNTIPPHILSYLTKTPIDLSVRATRIQYKTIDDSIIYRFSAKLKKLVEKCHLFCVIDTRSGHVSNHCDSMFKIEYDFDHNRIRFSTRTNVVLSGFELGTMNSFKKTLFARDHDCEIPMFSTHLFISCKNMSNCICDCSTHERHHVQPNPFEHTTGTASSYHGLRPHIDHISARGGIHDQTQPDIKNYDGTHDSYDKNQNDLDSTRYDNRVFPSFDESEKHNDIGAPDIRKDGYSEPTGATTELDTTTANSTTTATTTTTNNNSTTFVNGLTTPINTSTDGDSAPTTFESGIFSENNGTTDSN